MKKLLALLLLVAVIVISPSVNAQNTRLTVRINTHGETTIFESLSPTANIEDSLANLAYGMGAMQWQLDPVTMMLGSIYTTQHNSFLNKAALDQLLASNNPKFSKITNALAKGIRLVDSDGTIENVVPGTASIERIENFMKRMNIRAAAEAQLASMDPYTLRIIKRWLEGAQSIALGSRAAFYIANPEFQSTRIIDYFSRLTITCLLYTSDAADE